VRESARHPQVAQRWHQMRESAIGIIADYLRTAIVRGSLRPVKAEPLARIFLYNLIFIALIDETQEPETFLADMVSVLLEGALPL
jgi:hypothetical protein